MRGNQASGRQGISMPSGRGPFQRGQWLQSPEIAVDIETVRNGDDEEYLDVTQSSSDRRWVARWYPLAAELNIRGRLSKTNTVSEGAVQIQV